MKKIVLTITALAVMLIAGTALGQTTADMIAGNPKNLPANIVGEVTVSDDGVTLTVQYMTDPPWVMTETHLHVSTKDPTVKPYIRDCAIPMTKKGNPIPGQFDPATSNEYVTPQMNETYNITLAEICDYVGPDELFIAAHAVVELDCLGYLELELPDWVNLYIVRDAVGPAYFPEVIISGVTPPDPPDPTILDGTWPGWCLDPHRVINPNTSYESGVFSSYEDLPDGLVQIEDNLPCVNWILNNVEVGDESACVTPPDNLQEYYTVDDIQLAIWELLWDPVPQEAIDALSDWSRCRVDEIKAAADCDFVPDCCTDFVGIILVPERPNPRLYQPVLIKIPLDCVEETAWAGENVVPEEEWEHDFPGNNWALFITHTTQDPPPTP